MHAEFPNSADVVKSLTAATTQLPTGAVAPPSTFFNAEAAFLTSTAVSRTGFLPVKGGVVRARLSFDLDGTTLPSLQFSWQYAANLPAPQPAYFFLNADAVYINVDNAGQPTLKGLIDTLVQ